MSINIYKIRQVLRNIQLQGKLPEDDFGNVLSVDDLICWYSLEDRLTADEVKIVRHELELISEMQFLLGFD